MHKSECTASDNMLCQMTHLISKSLFASYQRRFDHRRLKQAASHGDLKACTRQNLALVVEFPTAGAVDSVQIFVALQAPPLYGLPRPHCLLAPSAVAPFASSATNTGRHAVPWWCQPTVAAIAWVLLSAIVRSGALVVEAASTTTNGTDVMFTAVTTVGGHRVTACPPTRCLDGVIAEIGEGRETIRGWKPWEVRHHWHVGEIETTRCPSRGVVIVRREVAVTIGIRPRGSDMCWVEDVGIDEGELSPRLAITLQSDARARGLHLC